VVDPFAYSFRMRMSVLVADDVKTNRVVLKSILQDVLPPSTKYVQVASGEEALELLRKGCFDVACLDEHYMSSGSSRNMLGSDVTRNVRQWEAEDAQRKKCIIIGCTHTVTDEARATSIAAGQDLVWGKPLPPLATVARQLTELHACRDQGAGVAAGQEPRSRFPSLLDPPTPHEQSL